MMDGTLPLDFAPQPDTRDDGLPLIIDSFAGGGGASTGIEMALGRSPDVAINHDANAVALHTANHPETRHLINSIYGIDPDDIAKPGQRVGLAWFSPDCKHFSKAKGGTPVNKNIRDLAWVVVHHAEHYRPEVILLENVEEFLTWGPLRHRHTGGRPSTVTGMTPELWDDAPPELKGEPVFDKNGNPFMEPCPLSKGTEFNRWADALRRLGYKVQWKVLRACDYGAPTIRKRLFVVARCDGHDIVWPEPTHGAPNSDDVKSGKLKPWRTAAEIIDWSQPCPSIFDTSEEIKQTLGLRAIRPLKPNTQKRIAEGVKRYVLNAQHPFIVNLTHGARLEDPANPLRTITGANRGEKALVAPSITKFNTGATGHDAREPLSTITANSFVKRPGGAAPIGIVAPSLASVAAPHMMTMRNAQKPFNGANEPTHTITAGGAGLALVAPSLLSLKGTTRRDAPLTAPHNTVLAGGGHSALISPVLTYAQHGGANRSVEDPHHTICANMKDYNGLIIPTLVQTGYGERKGQKPRALDLGKPLGTVVAGGAKHASIATWFAKYYGTGEGAPTTDPLHTITTKDRMAHMQATLDAPPFTSDHKARAREVAEFLRKYGAWDGGEFVTLEIDGQTFVIVDIGMRMLTPRELYRAQGFPEDYVIEGVWHQDDAGEWHWKPFTKNVQVSCCGNSVSPSVAEALVRANCGHLAMQENAV